MTDKRHPATGPVLVAIDFSDDSEAALIWAAHQAEVAASDLVVLHVVHDPAANPGFYQKPDDDWLRPMVDVAKEMMEDFLTKAIAAHRDIDILSRASSRLVAGLPAGRIVEVAEESGARLVVVGSRGLSGLDSILLGSVAERVIQTCPVPVVVVKASAGKPAQ